jgi:cellulose biosynthesis protein BcsQ
MKDSKKQALFIAFATQKGGVGKTTFTVLTASYLHYFKGYNVAVVDCDYPQYSVHAMRERDIEQVKSNEGYKRLAMEQFKSLNKRAYPILKSTTANAIDVVNEFLDETDIPIDLVLFDLPGTVNASGLINTLTQLDHIFIPITADRVVLESSLNFATIINKVAVNNPESKTKSLGIFWNQVDRREKTELYEVYGKGVSSMGLPLMDTRIPDSKRYRKETAKPGKTPFRSTLFPPNKEMERGSNLVELINEVCRTINI